MMMLATISLLVGAVLAQRFKVLILAPAIVLGLTAAAAMGIAYGEETWSITLGFAVIAAGLQLGYLGGSALQFAIRTMRERRFARAKLPVGASERSRG